MTILRNKGHGDFTEPASSPEPAGDTPRSVAAADLDGDADQDLAVANGDNEVTILRNNGNGNFREPATSPETAGEIPVSVAAADLDGDSDPDLAVANSTSDLNLDSKDNVTILRNNGNGNFREPATSPQQAGASPHSVAAADLDGDGDEDLAVANLLSDTVTILRNNGAGNFTEPASSPEFAQYNPVAVAAADFDGDSDPDLAVPKLTDEVTILDNNGNGNFTEPATSPEDVGVGPRSIAAADLDGDSDPDLAVPNFDSDNVTILRNR